MRDRELLAALRAEMKREGFLERATARIVFELVVYAALGVAFAVLALTADSFLMRAGAAFASAVFSLAVGTNTHSASHNAAARKRGTNEALTFFGYPLFLGLSATWWWHKHVAVHHPAPNVVGIDGDADLAPWFAITAEDARDGGPVRRFYYRRLQWLLFPVILGITGFRMQMFGWQYIVSTLRASGVSGGSDRTRKARIDLACVVVHYALWFGVPLLFFPASDVIGVYATRVVLIGYGMFAVLGPGHFPLDAAAVAGEHHKGDYILLQTASTVNFRTGFVGRMVCGGLEYQIEHHLFPDISHPHYPAAAPHIEQFCRAHGYPYRSYSWTRAVWEALRVFRSPKPVSYELQSLRVSPAADGAGIAST